MATDLGLLPSATLQPYGQNILKYGIGQLGTPIDVGKLTPQVAGQTAFQQQAAQGIADLGGLGQVQRDASGQVTGFTGGTGVASYQPYLDDISQQQLLDPAQGYQAFMSPYQKEIIDTTLADFDRQAQIRANEQAAATLGVPGAFGGGREGVQRAEYQAASDRNRAQALAGLRQSGFQNAANRRQQDLANQMGIANLQGGLGARAQDFSRAQISGLGTLGSAQQAQSQAVLDAQRQAAQMAVQDPQRRLNMLGSGVMGLMGGVGAGRTEIGEAPAAAQSSPLMQALGVGLAGADIYGRIFGSR